MDRCRAEMAEEEDECEEYEEREEMAIEDSRSRKKMVMAPKKMAAPRGMGYSATISSSNKPIIV